MKTNSEPEQLFQAAARNDAVSVKEMIAAGADPDFVSEKFGHIPLYNACISGAADSVKALIEAGANPNLRFTYRSPVDGRVEANLVALIHTRTAEVAKILIAAGADVNAADANGTTPLMCAAFNGKLAIVEILLQAGASPLLRQIKRAKRKSHTARELAESKIQFLTEVMDDSNRTTVEKRLTEYREVQKRLLKAESEK
jgi:uncharacterized protein